MNPTPDRSSVTPLDACGCVGSACGGDAVGRRTFLKIAGLASAAAMPGVAAGQTSQPAGGKIEHYVPADKQLPPEWIAKLTAKGAAEVFRGKDRAFVAMPIGGIGAGQLYLLGDGTLSCWQIFNHPEPSGSGGTNYNAPRRPSPVQQGFAVAVDVGGARLVRRLCEQDFPEVAFRGEYPIAKVSYQRADFPVSIEMEAFSPFIPLNAKDSGLPATVFNLTLRNRGDQPATVSALGWLENAVCCHSSEFLIDRAERYTRVVRDAGGSRVLHGARAVPREQQPVTRPEIVIADFEGGSYGDWQVEGIAFGTRPADGALPGQAQVKGFQGKGFVSSFVDGDRSTGKLTSAPFEINRRFINFKLGGGQSIIGKVAIRLLVDGRVVRSATGPDEEALVWKTWLVKEFAGKQGRIEISDNLGSKGAHINVDHIVLSDEVAERPDRPVETFEDAGTMALSVIGQGASQAETRAQFERLGAQTGAYLLDGDSKYGIQESRVGGLASPPISVAPNSEITVTFLLSWHFPNQRSMESDVGHAYAVWFKDAGEVADYMLGQRERLFGDTRKWRDTLYDSTLPWWLLDRLHSTLSYLATNTCQWWHWDQRFWAFEGVYCCFGTCTHVWNYAQGAGRLFPELERSVRERQDLGQALKDDGLVGFRGNDKYAADGQAGTILKCYREHQMSPDATFLRKHWPRVRKALEYLMVQDANADGLIENGQHNTFDIDFFGPNTFVGSLYLAALRAGEEMAREVGDTTFAERARNVFEAGSRLSVERLWNGEYFIQEVDLKEHPKHQYGQGCLSDQLFGQGWAHQLDLGYIYPREKVAEALRAVYKYNWAPDIGPQSKAHAPWRWFANPGEAGLFTCTWPRSEHLPQGVMYQNEIWTGIEYQVAGHMIWEGLTTEGLTICRAVHERYHPSKHNPYNEVECGDHYARALASWGVYTALQGFRYHGPRGELGFGPRLTPESFRAAFVTAEGWGTFSQQRETGTQFAQIDLRWGKLRLRTLTCEVPGDQKCETLRLVVGEKPLSASHQLGQGKLTIQLSEEITLQAGQTLQVIIA